MTSPLPENFLSLSVVEQVRVLKGLDAGVIREAGLADLLAELDGLLRANPLQAFVPHGGQGVFLNASSRVVAAFAGNRFGKTTCLAVRALVDCVDADCLPPHLRASKRWFPGVNAPDGVFGRIVNPSLKLNETVILPAFQRWVPREQLRGGAWGKAFDKQNSILRFRNGGFIEFMAYEQIIDKFGGAPRHFVGYDEPPPREIRDECMMRTADYGGYEMFAMTPLKANVAWVKRDIWRQRDAPHITVVRGSIHDNPTLNKDTVDAVLGDLGGSENDVWRRAREFGDFVDIGGLAYPEFDRSVVEPVGPEVVREWDVVVGIDPGVRNCGLTFNGFTSQDVLVTFDEGLVQDGVPSDYVAVIDRKLAEWGLARERVTFVIDPAARARGQVNAETVASALARLGVFCVTGQNDHEAGVQQLRDRMRHKRYQCFSTCVGLRAEMEDIALEDREDGVFKLVRGNDHRADTVRYVAMFRPFDAVVEQAAPGVNLGWRPGFAPEASQLSGNAGRVGPLGSMS